MLRNGKEKTKENLWNHFFGKYALIAHISSCIMLILPYPHWLGNKIFCCLAILIIVLFFTSIIATVLENLLEDDPFNFEEPLTQEDIDELNQMLEEYRKKSQIDKK